MKLHIQKHCYRGLFVFALLSLLGFIILHVGMSTVANHSNIQQQKVSIKLSFTSGMPELNVDASGNLRMKKLYFREIFITISEDGLFQWKKSLDSGYQKRQLSRNELRSLYGSVTRLADYLDKHDKPGYSFGFPTINIEIHFVKRNVKYELAYNSSFDHFFSYQPLFWGDENIPRELRAFHNLLLSF